MLPLESFRSSGELPPVSFACLLSYDDLRFAQFTIPHLLRMGSGQYQERILVLDELPGALGRSEKNASWVRVLAKVADDCCIDNVVRLQPNDSFNVQVSKKHFGVQLNQFRDHRGVPLLGWAAAIEASANDFVAYFDSDILLHETEGHSWVREAIQLLLEDPMALFVAPLPGPPCSNGLLGQPEPPLRDQKGNFRFKSFSSRRFLVHKPRFEQLLPIRPLYTSWRKRITAVFGGPSAYLPWESWVDAALRTSQFYRVHLSNSAAWTLHSPEHSPEWLDMLQKIIEHVEAGHFPPEQAGYYDLNLDAWQRYLSRES